MNTKIIIGGVIGAIVMFLLGFLIYGVIMGSMNPDMPEPTTMGLVWIFIANLSSGLLLAYIFGKWANISTLMGGMMAALVIGLLFAVAFDSYMMAFPEMMTEAMTVPMMVMDVILSTVITMGGGAAIGWYNGRGAAAA